MKKIAILAVIIASQSVFSANYPKAPDPRLTPGSLCETPDRYRHPEQIPYCDRNVNSFMKELVFVTYRKDAGYNLSGDRKNYKVDHYIPLCMGGSNNQDNLWPQHVSVGKITDQLEAMGCEVLAKGKITQAELIELVKQAKNDLKAAPGIFNKLKKMRN